MDAEIARRTFIYNPEDGTLMWREKKGTCTPMVPTTCQQKVGYKTVKYNGKKYYVHRLAWLITHGEWPKQTIDHINRIRDDNRIANLRDVSMEENMANAAPGRKRGSKTIRNVQRSRWGRGWTARAFIHGESIYLGTFRTAEDAYAAVLKKEMEVGINRAPTPLKNPDPTPF